MILARTVESLFSWLVRLSLLGAIIWAFVMRDWTTVFLSIFTLIAIIALPIFIRRRYNIKLPLEFEIGLSFFIYSTLFLGEVGDFYERFWWWDSIIHAGAAAGFGVIGLIALYAMHRSHKITASNATISIFSAAFAIALGALWEVFEFTMDQIFSLNMQKSGLSDTMWDLIVNTVSAFIVSLAGYFYLKYNQAPVLQQVIKNFIRKNPKLFN